MAVDGDGDGDLQRDVQDFLDYSVQGMQVKLPFIIIPIFKFLKSIFSSSVVCFNFERFDF